MRGAPIQRTQLHANASATQISSICIKLVRFFSTQIMLSVRDLRLQMSNGFCSVFFFVCFVCLAFVYGVRAIVNEFT